MLDANPDTRSTADRVLNTPWIMVRSASDADLTLYIFIFIQQQRRYKYIYSTV